MGVFRRSKRTGSAEGVGLDRRTFLAGTAVAGLGVAGLVNVAEVQAAGPYLGPKSLPSGTLASGELSAIAGKRPLIKKSFRPPNYETPVDVFNEFYTPNDAFFVRYHLADIPQVDGATWKLHVGGEGANSELELTLDDLKRMEAVEVTAVNQCSGNRRGLSDPHVPGVEWGYGAMGNAKWKGVRVRDVLNKLGVKPEAVEVVFNGADTGAIPETPDFRKSLPLWKVMDEHTLLAYSMNGQDLPHWNGYPVRLVVPGWTGTYWMKHVVTLDVVTKPDQNFWMKAAYRIPKGKFPVIDRFTSQETEVNTPITEMVVNSLITNLQDGQKFKVGQTVEVKGVAWDGGYGIQTVEVSRDGGKSWSPAALGRNEGKYSWQQWSYRFKASKKGQETILAKASNKAGATQTFQLIFNPAGYHNNVVSQVSISIA